MYIFFCFNSSLKKSVDICIAWYYTMYSTEQNKGGGIMDAQLKKGAIEMCVLHILKKNDSYGYDISEKISRFVEVNEGTIYPILRRLSDFDFVTTYLKESNDGPPRKYYKITESGVERYNLLKTDWLGFNKSVLKLMEENK